MANQQATTRIPPQELPLSAIIHDDGYRPRFDGVDAVDAVENGAAEYDGDDFTDRMDYSAEVESIIEKQDAATMLHRLMNGLNLAFPGDMVVFRRDDAPTHAPWTALRLSVLLGIVDSLYRQLYREFTDSMGRTQVAGLIPQRDKAFDRAKRLYGCRNPERLQFALEQIHRLDEQINYLEEMGNAAAAVYDAAAAKADSRGLLPDWLPMEYQKPTDRRKAWAKANAASPMSPIEYELMVRIDGRDAADVEVKRRQEAWAAHMGAK